MIIENQNRQTISEKAIFYKCFLLELSGNAAIFQSQIHKKPTRKQVSEFNAVINTAAVNDFAEKSLKIKMAVV